MNDLLETFGNQNREGGDPPPPRHNWLETRQATVGKRS